MTETSTSNDAPTKIFTNQYFVCLAKYSKTRSVLSVTCYSNNNDYYLRDFLESVSLVRSSAAVLLLQNQPEHNIVK